jgi:hypothetical protein
VSQFLRSLSRDLPLKIVAVLSAVFLWVFAVMDRTYSTRVTLPVELTPGANRELVTDLDTRSAVVTIEGKGKDLVGVRLRQLRFRVPVPEGKPGNRQLKLTSADLVLPAGVAVRAIEPEYVELRLNRAYSKIVAVQVPTIGQPPSGLSVQLSDPSVQVRLTGSDEELKLINTVSTETLNLAAVTQAGQRRLRVLLPEGNLLTAEPESIDVTIGLEREGARIFLGVPVRVTAPANRQTDLDPQEAQIAVAGPASRIDSLKAADIVAQIKISGLQPGAYRLAAEISLPSGFHMVKCEPQLFDVTVK